MSKFKYTLLLCIVFFLSGCVHQKSISSSEEIDLSIENTQIDYNRLIEHVATANYDEVICLELINGNPLCVKVEKILPTVTSSVNDSYLKVTVYEVNKYGELTITDIQTLKE